jgi:hypothetical protein
MTVDVKHRRIYWTEPGARGIRAFDLDKSQPIEFIVATGDSAAGVAVDPDAEKIYWTDCENQTVTSGRVRRANFDGSQIEDLVTNVVHPCSIAIDAKHGRVYWTSFKGRPDGIGKIQSANLNGTMVKDVVVGIDTAGLALDIAAGKLYWAEGTRGKIQQANLDGTGIVDLVSGLEGPTSVAIDFVERKIYWTDSGAGDQLNRIQRANLNGSKVETLFESATAFPWGIAVLFDSKRAIPSHLSIPSTSSEEGPAKLAIPEKEDQEIKIKLVKDTYQSDAEIERSSDQAIAIAVKLLADALETTDDTAGRYVMLNMAANMAARSGDIETALRATERIGREYQIDVLAKTMETFKELSAANNTRNHHRSLAPAMSDLAIAAINDDRYDVAWEAASLALLSARKARDSATARRTTTQIKDIEGLRTDFAIVQTALTSLISNPADPDANLVAGKFYCFNKGAWDSGIPMLALSSDVALKALAESELDAPLETVEQIKLGDSWWDLSKQEKSRAHLNTALRARYWYEKALPMLSGLTRARIEKRLGEIQRLEQ